MHALMNVICWTQIWNKSPWLVSHLLCTIVELTGVWYSRNYHTPSCDTLAIASDIHTTIMRVLDKMHKCAFFNSCNILHRYCARWPVWSILHSSVDSSEQFTLWTVGWHHYINYGKDISEVPLPAVKFQMNTRTDRAMIRSSRFCEVQSTWMNCLL